ncbi:2-oxoacid dehydrogenases acyltransferase (catalytic domain) [Candidatus Bilamarchaeum dharawalense]|uniref:2-oxoacid dehydrogenases acyltransferase (Catalytic domain) n=1 Tax=Candidatus Bilamarchaeum dharawalense TaxID=2885759 RepID=A0A5E4LNI5_9ARCH|nr:2-oxoacid dehydrogenases acyltransferase (catalytic domain) [Candidatus Bilamarchaeum dharawalense]
MVSEFRFPDVGEGIHEGVIVKWRVREGEVVSVDQVLVEVETDKAVVELPSPFAGTVLKINFKEGDQIKVGQSLIAIGEPGESVAKTTEIHGPTETIQIVEKRTSEHVLATPSVRKLSREMGVDLTMVHGTGPGGRITEEDVRSAPTGIPKVKETAHVVTKSEGVVVSVEEGDQMIQLSHLRKIIAERMVYSKTHIPHACGMDFVDVTKLTELREREKKAIEARGVKLTYLPFIIKACAIALHEFPEFNAQFDEQKNVLIVKKQLNIGIAVETSDGLMVPVIKDIDKKSIVEIAQEIEHLANAARERKIKLEEIKGGTFTITNVGSLGGMYSTPIINAPEVAIMGVHRIKDMPLVVKEKIKPRKVLGLSLCFDHRVNDGAKATAFMNAVMKHLEDPDLMLVDMI